MFQLLSLTINWLLPCSSLTKPAIAGVGTVWIAGRSSPRRRFEASVWHQAPRSNVVDDTLDTIPPLDPELQLSSPVPSESMVMGHRWYHQTATGMFLPEMVLKCPLPGMLLKTLEISTVAMLVFILYAYGWS